MPDQGHGELVATVERSTHLLELYFERELADLGVTQAEAHILGRLGRAGSTSTNNLHRLFGHKRSTLTSVLDRLERRGYTRREIHPDDRRSFLITLTDDGARAAAVVTSAVERLEREIASGTSERDRKGFAAVMDALAAAAGSS